MQTRSLFIVGAAAVLCGCTGLVGSVLPRASSRPTPLHFGLYVTPDPAHNPIDPPERFIGFHTGTDFETFPSEADIDVPVFAICNGEVVYSGAAEGYGGVVVQRCQLQGQEVTVLYGHLLLTSLAELHSSQAAGQQIAVLGPAKSADTGFTRKHLHLDIHKGTTVEFLGYVQTEDELKNFIDPQTVR